MLLAPHADDLPPPKAYPNPNPSPAPTPTPNPNPNPSPSPSPNQAYHVSDALLQWSSDKEGRLSARGFGVALKAAYATRAPRSGLLGRFTAFFGGASRPRTPLSAADPSGLAGAEVGCEDDVLHLTSEQLPTFSGRVSEDPNPNPNPSPNPDPNPSPSPSPNPNPD